MKSRTSFFNGTVLRKDLTRFAPVWVLYGIFLLLVLLMLQASSETPAMIAQDFVYLMSPMVWLNLLYAGICAALLFGDLFKSRLCNALHTMPLRREGWLLTHLCAGMLFCLIPCGTVTLIACLLLQKYFYMALLWLAVTVLQFLFFFGLGTFCAMCAGNRLGMVAMYGLINFLTVLAYVLAELFYAPLLHGIMMDTERFHIFSPVLHLTDKELVLFEYGKMQSYFRGFVPEVWRYLLLVAAIGVVLLVLSVLIYRRRNLESAGDFISFRPVAPVFLILYSLGVGALLYGICTLFDLSTDLLFLAVGLLIGFFTGRMLLERTIKVFRWKNILACLALVAAVAGSMALTWLDPMNITRYIPEADRVESALLYSGSEAYRYQNHYTQRELTSPEEIDMCRRIHEQLANDRSADGQYLMDLWVKYTLTDGTTVTRFYRVYQDSPIMQELKDYLSDPRTIFHVNDWEDYASSVVLASCDLYDSKYADYEATSYTITTPQQLDGLMAAIQADCEAGRMIQDWDFHFNEDSEGWLQLSSPKYGDVYLDLYTGCINTVTYLRTLPLQ